MPVKVVGNYPKTARADTGIFSIDRALGNPLTKEWGMPLRSLYEIFGYPHTGKSTLSYFLAGRVRLEREKGNEILLADLEGLDRDYLSSAVGASGFNGVVRITPHEDEKGKSRPHEALMQDVADEVGEETVSSGILDSVGAIQPIAESAGDVGEAFVGRRAKAMAQFCRRAVGSLRSAETPGAVFVVNHLHPIIGGRGSITPGGQTLEYLSGVRIQIISKKDDRFVGKETGEVLGILSKGYVRKLRFGGPGREFQFFLIPGQGIHTGLSAMFDCIKLGLAVRETTVKIGKKSYGYISKLIEAGRAEDDDKFDPFKKALSDKEE